MKTFFLLFASASTMALGLLAQAPNGNGNGNGGDPGEGTIVVPDSSKESVSDVGRKLHTKHLILLRGQGRQGYISGLTPADIQTAYSLTGLLGGAGTIAIVDAYHYPNAAADLATFSAGAAALGFTAIPALPACGSGGKSTACFRQVYADSSGKITDTVPPVNCGWNQEAALDIQWAHAMAPNASIVLVEAQSNSYADLFGAVKLATSLVSSGGEVSMSWGGSEYAGQTSYDDLFNVSGVVFIASSGDTGGKTIYPSTSPYVIAAGGTTLNMSGVRGSASFVSETGWSGSGGGTSAYEPRLSYQSGIEIAGSQRLVPDLSFDADPSTGVLVYGPTCSAGSTSGWMIFGGTSVSAPALAGIINSAAEGRTSAPSTVDELQRIYDLTPGLYRDILLGRAGRYKAGSGWDFVTGVGTPVTTTGK